MNNLPALGCAAFADSIATFNSTLTGSKGIQSTGAPVCFMRSMICALITVMFAWFAGVAIGGISKSTTEEHRAQRRFGPGVCGPADPSYIRVSTETGGQPFFLSSAEVAKSAQIMSGSLLQSDLMLWASGDGEKAYSVALDSSVERTATSESRTETSGKGGIRRNVHSS